MLRELLPGRPAPAPGEPPRRAPTIFLVPQTCFGPAYWQTAASKQTAESSAKRRKLSSSGWPGNGR